MEDPTQTTEPTPTQTTEPTVEPTPAAPPQEPVSTEPPTTLAEPAAAPEPQQTTEPQGTTEPEPEPQTTEPAEPEPDARVVPKPSEYELPEGIPDQLRIFAHEHGFTQEQLTATLTQFNGYIQGMQEQEQTAMRQLGEAHVKSWGDQAKNNMVLAKSAMNWLGENIEGFNDYLTKTPAGNNPLVLQALYLVGKNMQEGGFLPSTPRRPGQKTAATAMYGENHPSNS